MVQSINDLLTLKRFKLVELSTMLLDEIREDMNLKAGEKQGFCTLGNCTAFSFEGAFEKFRPAYTSDFYGDDKLESYEVSQLNNVDKDGYAKHFVCSCQLKGNKRVVVEYLIILTDKCKDESFNTQYLKRDNFTDAEIEDIEGHEYKFVKLI